MRRRATPYDRESYATGRPHGTDPRGARRRRVRRRGRHRRQTGRLHGLHPSRPQAARRATPALAHTWGGGRQHHRLRAAPALQGRAAQGREAAHRPRGGDACRRHDGDRGPDRRHDHHRGGARARRACRPGRGDQRSQHRRRAGAATQPQAHRHRRDRACRVVRTGRASGGEHARGPQPRHRVRGRRRDHRRRRPDHLPRGRGADQPRSHRASTARDRGGRRLEGGPTSPGPYLRGRRRARADHHWRRGGGRTRPGGGAAPRAPPPPPAGITVTTV
jgi:hypothetical protein